MAEEDFLRRWARRKSEAGRLPVPAAGVGAAERAPTDSHSPGAGAPSPALREQSTSPAASSDAVASESPAEALVRSSPVAGGALPDPASLEPGADVSAFMAKGVNEALRRRALKSLFQDPRFNVMDGMDVYIDDYSIPDPMPPEWLDKLEQLSHLGDRGARDREAEAREAAGGDAALVELEGAEVEDGAAEPARSQGDTDPSETEDAPSPGEPAAEVATSAPPIPGEESAPRSATPS